MPFNVPVGRMGQKFHTIKMKHLEPKKNCYQMKGSHEDIPHSADFDSMTDLNKKKWARKCTYINTTLHERPMFYPLTLIIAKPIHSTNKHYYILNFHSNIWRTIEQNQF